LKIRQDIESAGSSAFSPNGREKSTLGPLGGFNSSCAAASSHFWTLRGKRMIELPERTAHVSVNGDAR
jgi:hypothetical protein